jgi:hypothetical protein
MKQVRGRPEGSNKVVRVIFVAAFALTFIGGLTLGVGATKTVEGAAPSRPTPSWIAIPTNGPDSNFGKPMADGTLCGVDCESQPYESQP